jgi:phosphosulfolactate synthase
MKSFLKELPKRASKPRQTGLTLVTDKGLSVGQAENLLSVADPYIDFIKLGFGTALFTRNLELQNSDILRWHLIRGVRRT